MLSTVLNYGVYTYLKLSEISRVLQTSKDIYCIKPIAWREGWKDQFKLSSEFFLAVYSNKIEQVRYLLQCGASVNYQNDFAIRCSAGRGNLELVKLLTEAGANIHAKNNIPLRRSAENGHLDVVKYLLESGANRHIINRNMIYTIVINGHLNILKFLAENGFEFQKNDLLSASAVYGKLDIVKYFIEVGANVNTITEQHVENILERGYLEVMKTLVDAGLKIPILNSDVLQRIAQYGYEDIIIYLVEAGVGVETITLGKVVENGNLSFVKYLLENGASVSDIDNKTLTYCMWIGYYDIVKFLLEKFPSLHQKEVYY